MSKMWILITVLFLVICSISDIRSRTVDIRIIALYAAIGFFVCPIMDIRGIIPGLFILAISIFSKGKIGLGDGYVVMAVGLFSDCSMMIELCMLSLLISGLVSAFFLFYLFITHKEKNDWTLPMTVFILMGYLVYISNYG